MFTTDTALQKQILSGLDISCLESVLENMPNGIMLLDEAGKVSFLNREFSELTGYSLADLGGLSHYDVVRLIVADAEGAYEEIKASLNLTLEGRTTSAKRKLHHRNGYEVPVEITGYPVRDSSLRTRAVMLIWKDLHADLLLKITSTINSSLQLSDVLKNTTTVVVNYLGLGSNAVFLLDRKMNGLRLISCNLYESEEDLPKLLIPMGQGAPGQIAQTRQPVYVANLGDEALTNDIAMVGSSAIDKFKNKSSIGYPLVFRDELLGVIAFDAETVREFSRKEKRLFETIASQVALAIYNAQLYARIEHLAITDGLTGLYNQRYFRDRLAEELDRSKRNQGFISLMMLDIDYFKNYNDVQGHLQGDQLLVDFASIIKSNVRKYDIVCRYGGEEFAVILPDCTQDEAAYTAERIRSACEDHEFFGREQQPAGRVTVSIGVSFYPKASTGQDLILFADRALYKAKHRKRNKVECYV